MGGESEVAGDSRNQSRRVPGFRDPEFAGPTQKGNGARPRKMRPTCTSGARPGSGKELVSLRLPCVSPASFRPVGRAERRHFVVCGKG